ncbi:MAG: hypothetical protein IJF90_07485 [Synergistaceae bacterium]|nr:hypothetical protein [Synergistaceae bacterium]MBQ3758036.1 hypothetical protein [Synergistaceae bacterium]MBQ6115390.1 hypothetical protein [Synergistaceae bacterium]MBQ6665987.1 hypothetical protein [Synergistaceae bacterium]MBQ6981164.1 hypothetical protein [Synergistaceae bacterium]
MKRKGETLTEFLTAVTVFGLMAAGIFEFIANQTENLADIKNKDELMFYAQKYTNTPKDKRPSNNITVEDDNGVKSKYNLDDDKTLTVTLLTDDEEERASMTFSLKP